MGHLKRTRCSLTIYDPMVPEITCQVKFLEKARLGGVFLTYVHLSSNMVLLCAFFISNLLIMLSLCYTPPMRERSICIPLSLVKRQGE